MRNAILLMLAPFVLASCAMAGDEATPKVSKGDKAWLFTLNGLSNLGAGNYNGGVGAKYYISDGTALRLSLGFGTSNTTYKYTGPTDPTRADEKISGTVFSITPGIIANFTTNGTI